MKKQLKKILGDPQAKHLKRYKKRIHSINKLEEVYLDKKDIELKEEIAQIITELSSAKSMPKALDENLPRVFAIVREAARRTLGQRHFDVQLIGGMALHEGKVAEMKTGEGKTLVATLPVVLNALTKKGVHLVTVNDYLVRRDAGWMGQIYNFLGLSVGVVIPDASFIYDTSYSDDDHADARFRHLKPCTRQEAYAADITYSTNNELGFDYLRDNMVREVDQLRQRNLHYAIVDEVDSILIDEARTPLIISSSAAASSSAYDQFARLIRTLEAEKHYEIDEKRRTAILTHEGILSLERSLGLANLYSSSNVRVLYHIDQALKAESLFKRDKDYVVTHDGEVVIVDDFTGRLLKGRRYSEGLHQAIEAKEGVKVQEESMTLATISFQNYFRLYEKLSGMTGTAETEAEEFHSIYKLDVIEIPANRPVVREDLGDRIYRTEMGKFQAIVEETKKLQEVGQPVLIGTVSIEKNEVLSRMLTQSGVKHQVLNAKNNEKEAAIVAEAGTKGAVTLATNIAGRGTDIVLNDETKSLGGLHVIGSERHESRRIDNQLRGRSGRQGDPGTTQFFVSTEDDLMRIFGGNRIGSVMAKINASDDMPVENRIISKALENAQKKVEGFKFDARKDVVDYDDVMNRHRRATYTMRKEILHQADIHARIKDFVSDEVKELVTSPESLTANFETMIMDVFPLKPEQLDDLFDTEARKFDTEFRSEVNELLKQIEDDFGTEIMRRVERDVYLQVLDHLWMQHLENMDHLREGIGLSSVGQKDPLVEYRRQSQILFDRMQRDLRHEVIKLLFRAQPNDSNAPAETELTRAARSSVDNADKILEAETFGDDDFDSSEIHVKTAVHQNIQEKTKHNKIKQKRKTERKRKSKSRK
jgi:preprotein translocase subunit SecA